MAKLKIYLDARAVKEGKPAPLKVSVSSGGDTCYIPLDVSVLPSQWDAERQAVVKHPRKDFINRLVTEKLLDYREDMLSVMKRGMSAAQLKRAMLGLHGGGSPMVEDRILKYMESCRTEGNRRTFADLLKDLRRFDPKSGSLTMDDVGREYLERFDRHMAETKSVNSRAMRMRSLRAVFNAAIDDGLTDNYPFRRFKIRKEPTRKRSMTVEDFRRLRDYPCEPWQAEYRDMFLLMTYLIGVNAVDLFLAPPDAVRNGRFEYVRAKTHKLYGIRVEPEAEAVIERYRGRKHLLRAMDTYSDYHDYLHHMNDALKAIGRAVGKRGRVDGPGLFPQLSSYWSRHTWATVAASLDVPVETVSRALGHSFGAAVTNIYIDFDMKKVDAANRLVIDYLNSDFTDAKEFLENTKKARGTNPPADKF